jgi:hypothetical protein
MVEKHAAPPTKFEIGSARKTPSTPRFDRRGRRIVRGTTMTIFLNKEKKIACLAFPRDWNTVCPENWSAIMKKPKK